MEPTKTNTLKAPGATLYYEVRGSGPVLLLICGGIYDAAGYAGLAQRLADRYTVVTYDRRGNSRSPLDGPPEHQSIAVHADDAHLVLSAVGVTGEAPAYVFGNSSGAMIGLELAVRHPEQVRTLVAHEPPVFDLLPDRDHWRAVIQDVADAFLKEGAGTAMQVFTTAMEMTGGEPAEEDGDDAPSDQGQHMPEPDPEMMAMMARMGKNMEFFIGYEVPPFAGHVLDVAALSSSGVRVMPAVGGASEGEPPHRATLALAEELKVEPVVFPGDHGGFGSHAEPFAVKLVGVLSNT
ncbi:alpha/beta fold hydrolase [Sphaerisporangium perillae]|uniref:alpha/beta fold hydrolase n=1 Tax=Sphaerisporangium perillae TaxID=2935860 RepID=UPI00200C2060|nr:alpha/beta hydrolase [Sphaerisporangium perillae]